MTETQHSQSWTFASGRAAVLEARMAPMGLLDKLVQAAHTEDVVQALRGFLIGEDLSDAERLEEADVESRRFYHGMVEDLQRLCPAPWVAELLLVQRDLQGFKNHVKRAHLGMDVEPIESRYADEVWERLWTGLETDAAAVLKAVAERVRERIAGRDAAALFDAAFDSASLWALCEAAGRAGSEFIREYFVRLDTAKGVELLWRAKALEQPEQVQQLLAEGRTSADLFASLLERDTEDWTDLLAAAMPGLSIEEVASAKGEARVRAFVHAADRWLMSYVRDARFVPFGPERVFGCLVGLLTEGHNVALAAGGRANGIAPEVLAPHLKATYV